MPPPAALGSGYRRAKNGRYRRNRAGRSDKTVVSWNAEGLCKKVEELQRWLPAVKADVLAVQEAQLPKIAPRLPGHQPPAVVRRARGRVTGGSVVKGGDVALYIRAGRHFDIIDDHMTTAADNTTELCGVRLLDGGMDGQPYLTVINIYRPPIRATGDDRADNFDPTSIPTDDRTLVMWDFNAHQPLWDAACDGPDEVRQRVTEWLDDIGWRLLNSGEPTFTSYRSESHSVPDLAMCGDGLARRSTWEVGQDLGSDHLPMKITIRASHARPQRTRNARVV